MSVREPVVVLFGPTAVGKTELLLRLYAGTPTVEVITADSMQVYRHLDIGTAKPSAEILQRIPHHLISVVEPEHQFNAGEFVARAEELVRAVRSRGRVPIVSGGTAYYLRSFVYGLPDSPPGDPKVRRDLKRELEEGGLERLLKELERVDPLTAGRIAPRDGYRVLRALEVFRTSGRPLSEFHSPSKPREDFRVLLVGLERDREELYRRIDRRVEEMFETGLPEEIRGLIAAGYGPGDPGLRGIGYREFFIMQAGCLPWGAVRQMIQQNSRRYAKRQLTFFRALSGVQWFDPEDARAIGQRIDRFLHDPLSEVHP